MPQSPALWLCYQIPEAFLMIFCGTRLLGLKIEAKRFWAAVLLLAAAVPLARMALFTTGLHTIVLYVIVVTLAVKLFNVSFPTGLAVSTIAFFFLTMGEYMVMVPATTLLKLDLPKMITGTLLSQLEAGYLGLTLLMLGALTTQLFGFVLIEAPEARTPRGRAGEA